MKSYATCFLCLFLPAIVFSQAPSDTTQKVWTIEECVNYAIANNIQVKQSQLQTQIAKRTHQAAIWDYAPNLNANTSYGWNFGLNIDPVTNQISQSTRQTASMGLNSSWILFDGGRKYNLISKSNLDYVASLFDLEQAKNDISLNVAGSFLQILLNKEILEVAREQERLSTLQVDRMQKLVDAGSRPQGDLLQLQAQQARDEQNTIGAENALALSKLQLANLLQLQDPTDFDIVSPELELPDPALVVQDPGGIYTTAKENQPSIKAAETRIESSKEAVDMNRSGFLPTLSLQGQVGTSYSNQIQEVTATSDVTVPVPYYDNNGDVQFVQQSQTVPTNYANKSFGDQVSDNINEYVGISLSIPIFNRYAVKSNYQIAKINKQVSELQLEQEKNTLRQTIYQAHADAKASYNSYLAARKAVESSQKSYEYAEERFNLGGMNQFDYESAKNDLAVAKSEMLKAKYDYIFKIKVLEFYLTNQIKLNP